MEAGIVIERASGIRGGLPSFRYTSDTDLQRIHAAALEILDEPGLRVITEEARTALLAGGATQTSDDVIHFPADLVERAIESAPKQITIFDRNGNEAMRLGEGNAYFGAGVTCLYFIDPVSGERVEYSVPNMADATKLADALDGIDFIASPGTTRATDEMPIQLVNQYEFRAMASNTTKPLVILIADGPSQEDAYEMAALVSGSPAAFEAKPWVVPYLNTVSPLMIAEETCDKLIISAKRGLPVACQAAPQIGATAPIHPVGAVVLSAAETLAGLVITQVVNPGSPFISGVVPFAMDMRWANVSTGGPPGLAFQTIMADLCHFMWHLPMVGVGAGAADSKLPDQQKALESTYYTFGAVLSGVDMMFDAGSYETALSWSPEALVLDNEVISMIRTFVGGYEVNDETLSVGPIRDVGPGEHFLAHPQTLGAFRDVWQPSLLSWEARTDWNDRGSTNMGERARLKAVELIQTHQPEPLSDAVLKGMHEIIERRRVLIPEDDW